MVLRTEKAKLVGKYFKFQTPNPRQWSQSLVLLKSAFYCVQLKDYKPSVIFGMYTGYSTSVAILMGSWITGDYEGLEHYSANR